MLHTEHIRYEEALSRRNNVGMAHMNSKVEWVISFPRIGASNENENINHNEMHLPGKDHGLITFNKMATSGQ